jgi:hypothetical protein
MAVLNSDRLKSVDSGHEWLRDPKEGNVQDLDLAQAARAWGWLRGNAENIL